MKHDEKLLKAMKAINNDLKNDDSVWSKMEKERLEKTQKEKDFFHSKRLNQIIDNILSSNIDEFMTDDFYLGKLDSIFDSQNEMDLFFNAILLNAKYKYIENDDDVIIYLNNKFIIRFINSITFHRQFKVLANEIQKIERTVLGIDSETNEKYGVLVVCFDNNTKIHSFGNKDLVIEKLVLNNKYDRI